MQHDPSASDPRPPVPAPVPWVLWFALVSGFTACALLLGRDRPVEPSAWARLGWLPIAAGVAVRLLVIPRCAGMATALPAYIVCLALTESGGLLGVLLGGEARHAIVGTALAVLLLHNPAFALGRFRDAGPRR